MRGERLGGSRERVIRRKLVATLPRIALVGTGVGALNLVVYALARLTGRPPSDLTRDPLAVTEGPVYLGLESNVGIIFWCVAASISFFAAALLWRESRWNDTARFLVASGGLTTVLLVDDLFQLHEWFGPYVLKIPDEAVIALYGAGALAYAIRFRRVIVTSRFALLVLAALAFGGSIVVDWPRDVSATGTPGFDGTFVEDALKLVGIVAWFGYLTGFSLRACREQVFARHDE